MKKKIYLFLVESSLELIPREISNHPSVLNDAKRKNRRPSDLLLNISKHYHAMKRLKSIDKRGRPDIVHLSLLTALDSPLNKAGFLRVYVHTINEELIEVDPKVKLPRDYDRFEGLIVQLFKEGHVPKERPYLLRVVNRDLKTVLSEKKIEFIIGLSRVGGLVNLEKFLRKVFSEKNKIGVFIGGFHKGHFSKEILSHVNKLVSISKYPLTSHLTVCKVLNEVEKILDIV